MDTIIPEPKRIIRSKLVHDQVAHLPRRHLGFEIYTSQLKAGGPPSPDGMNSGRGWISESRAIPRFDRQENCTYTVKVPRLYLEHEARQEITARKQVWGTDIYTDDSDVIAACLHSGWFRGAWGEDVDEHLLGLEIENADPGYETNGKGKGKGKESAIKIDETIYEPPRNGPHAPPKDVDLHVTVLILPALQQYVGCIRFGIASRDFIQQHDGMSFAIHSIKWVSGEPAHEIRGESRRERMKRFAMQVRGIPVGGMKWVPTTKADLEALKRATQKAAALPKAAAVSLEEDVQKAEKENESAIEDKENHDPANANVSVSKPSEVLADNVPFETAAEAPEASEKPAPDAVPFQIEVSESAAVIATIAHEAPLIEAINAVAPAVVEPMPTSTTADTSAEDENLQSDHVPENSSEQMAEKEKAERTENKEELEKLEKLEASETAETSEKADRDGDVPMINGHSEPVAIDTTDATGVIVEAIVEAPVEASVEAPVESPVETAVETTVEATADATIPVAEPAADVQPNGSRDPDLDIPESYVRGSPS
jgi:hypothetical protein